MPTTIYDSSLITQRRRDKAISGSFINHIQNPINPTTGSAPLLGISQQSIINTVKNGHMTTYRKNDGGCTTESLGCPCTPLPIITPSVNTSLIAQWATILSQTNSDPNETYIRVQGVVTDTNNNVYVSGYYLAATNTITIQNVNGITQTPSLITLPITNNFSPFLVKYNILGEAKWATNIVTNSNGFYPFSQNISINNDHIYMTGTYSALTASVVNNAFNDTQVASGITLRATTISTPALDTFLIKYDLNGSAEWATTVSSNLIDCGTSIAFDSSNDVYITGFFNGTTPSVIYDALGLTQTASSILLQVTTSGNAVYLIKYNSLGQAQWATYFDGIGGFDRGISITIDSLDGIYITGNYFSPSGQVTLRNASGNTQTLSLVKLPTNTSIDTFLVKYNISGEAQWATYLKATSTDSAFKVVTDLQNNIYITANYTSISPVIFYDASVDNQPLSLVTLPISSVLKSSITKYNSSGKVQWSTYIDGSLLSQSISLSIDSSNNIYIVGDYHGIGTVYNANVNSQIMSAFTFPTNTIQSSYLVKYNSDGIVINAICFVGSTSATLGQSCTVDSLNNIYILGIYNSTIPVIPYNNISQNILSPSLLSLPPVDFYNGYLVKYTSL